MVGALRAAMQEVGSFRFRDLRLRTVMKARRWRNEDRAAGTGPCPCPRRPLCSTPCKHEKIHAAELWPRLRKQEAAGAYGEWELQGKGPLRPRFAPDSARSLGLLALHL